MTVSQKAATSLVPLLARVILCLAFVPIGWNKVMETMEFRGEDATRLAALLGKDAPVADPDAAEAAAGEPVLVERRLHAVTLLVDRAGWPSPVLNGWAAGLTELIGGALLLLGLGTRIWGLGLAIAMGVALWLTSWNAITSTWVFGMDIPTYNRFAAQIALFGLAFGLVLTGAGRASLDHAIFGGRRGGDLDDDWDDDLDE